MQKPIQLQNEYAKKAMRCYEVYDALADKFAEKEELREALYQFAKYKALSDLFATVVRRNRGAVHGE